MIAVLGILALLAPQGPLFDAVRKTELPTVLDVLDQAVVDVDQDGDDDVILAGHDTLRLLRNLGGGRVRVDAIATVPQQFRVVAAGDVDGDGLVDLATASLPGLGLPGRVRLYLGDGRGGFRDASAQVPPTDQWLSAIALVDVDGDGDLDLVATALVVNSSDGTNRLYENDGSGRFHDASGQLPAANQDSTSLATGDVDGDRDIDLLIGNEGSPLEPDRLLLNDGAGRFSDATAAAFRPIGEAIWKVALVDVDADGDLDVLEFPGVLNPPRLRINDGAGRFTTRAGALPPSGIDQAQALAFGDVDGDGTIDLWLGETDRGRLLVNDGSGRFVADPDSGIPEPRDVEPTAANLFDLDRDGDLDLLVGGARTELFWSDRGVRFFDARERLGPAPRLPHPAGSTSADLNGDGDPDLVFTRPTDRPTLALGTGSGHFVDAPRAMPATPLEAHLVRAVDVDRDGDLDLLFGGGVGIALYANRGDGNFVDISGTHLPSPRPPVGTLRCGDLDGDGAPDFVIGSTVAGAIVCLNDGTGRFAYGQVFAGIGGDLRDLALFDADGDGDLDAMFAKGQGLRFPPTPDTERLYLNDGSARFRDVSATHVPPIRDHSAALAVADVDGDGDLDVFVVNEGVWGVGELNRLLLNVGAGRFVDRGAVALPARPDHAYGAAFADVDRDGAVDLIVAHGLFDPHGLATLRGDGRGNFREPPTPSFPQGPGSFVRSGPLEVVDVDRDGDADLLVGEVLWVNHLRQHRARTFPRLGRSWKLDCVLEPERPGLRFVVLPLVGLARSPAIEVPGLGPLRLRPDSLFALPARTVGTLGAWNVTVPNLPALAGLPLGSQLLIADGRTVRLSNVAVDGVRP